MCSASTSTPSQLNLRQQADGFAGEGVGLGVSAPRDVGDGDVVERGQQLTRAGEDHGEAGDCGAFVADGLFDDDGAVADDVDADAVAGAELDDEFEGGDEGAAFGFVVAATQIVFLREFVADAGGVDDDDADADVAGVRQGRAVAPDLPAGHGGLSDRRRP